MSIAAQEPQPVLQFLLERPERLSCFRLRRPPETRNVEAGQPLVANSSIFELKRALRHASRAFILAQTVSATLILSADLNRFTSLLVSGRRLDNCWCDFACQLCQRNHNEWSRDVGWRRLALYSASSKNRSPVTPKRSPLPSAVARCSRMRFSMQPGSGRFLRSTTPWSILHASKFVEQWQQQ